MPKTPEQKKKLALIPHISLYHIMEAWGKTKTLMGELKSSILYAYYSMTLWIMERFITCDYPLTHKRYGKVYKNKTRLEYAKYYTGKEKYNDVFNRMWKLCSIESTTEKYLIHILLQANLTLLSNNPLSTMCGIQPIVGPVGTIFRMQYKYVDDGPPNQRDLEFAKAAGLDAPTGVGKRMVLEILTSTTQAVVRKLKAGFTLEVCQDLEMMHSINLESELTSAIVDSVQLEYIDNFVNTVSETCETKVITIHNNEIESVLLHINAAANEIGRKTRRGTGNILWVTPLMLSYIKKANRIPFVPVPHSGNKVFTGVNFAGTLGNSNIEVHVVALPEGIDAIMGYKGRSGETDAGIIMSPYIPLQSTGYSMDPVTSYPTANFVTKYGVNKTENTEDDINIFSSWDDYYMVIKVRTPDGVPLQEAA